MPLLFPAVPSYQLPLSLGQDLVVDFQNNTGGTPTNWADGTVVTLTVDAYSGGISVSVTATVSTYHAVCYVGYSTTDKILSGALWRAVATVPGGLGTPETVEVAIANGVVQRRDGR